MPIDVSKKLGELMLGGWVLTDEPCKTCPVPLMRSPKGRSPVTMYCANCDGDPQNGIASASSSAQSPTMARQPSPSTISSGTRISRSSTPPTELSSGLSSPTFAPPVETAESIRRRQQSDAASAEIGKRLLKGWAMLADECPNSRCYGVPLVRPPLAGGRDPRKECVACGTIYIDEKDAAGWEHLIKSGQNSNIVEQTTNEETISIPTSVEGKGKERAYSHSRELITESGHIIIGPASEIKSKETVNTLNTTSAALELSLRALSQRLSSLASLPGVIEPSSIGNTAEAMSKVLQALEQVGKLRGEIGS